MFGKLYGQMKDRQSLVSILDELQEDLKTVRANVSAQDRQLLEEHETFVPEMEAELKDSSKIIMHDVPELEPGIREDNDNMPTLSKMNIELMVNSFVNDFSRIATLQYTNSVGGAKMKWIGVNEGHHSLSHSADSKTEDMEKLTKINKWFCGELAHLAKRLDETPEPGGNGSLLDHTTIIWTNDLGKGSSHTLDNIPFVMVGGGLGFDMGQSLKLGRVAHNRLLLSLAHSFGHPLKTFGNPNFCGDGPLVLS
jgi:hypothetical protein